MAVLYESDPEKPGAAVVRARQLCRSCTASVECRPVRSFVIRLKENSMNNLKRSSLALAAAAAAMFSFVAVANAADSAGKMHCEGVNSCKGTSACKTANNACKGQNSCKGMGFLEMSKAECDAAKEKLKADAAK